MVSPRSVKLLGSHGRSRSSGMSLADQVPSSSSPSFRRRTTSSTTVLDHSRNFLHSTSSDARPSLDEMPESRLVPWTNSVSSSFTGIGHAELSLHQFICMLRSGLRPDKFGISSALKACRIAGELDSGRLLHGCTIKSGLESYALCSTSVLDMYVKCGDVSDARRLFDKVPTKCEALWNAMIDGYVRNSDFTVAFELFRRMLLSDTFPNSYTYAILVKLCTVTVDIELVRFFHARIVKAGFEKYGFVGGALVNVYAKWGDIDDASRVFWCLEDRDHAVWSALLAGFHQSGDAERGLDLYLKFVSEGNKLDQFTFSSVFNLCSDLKSIVLGSQVHSCLVKSGFALDSFVGNALVDMYVGLGMITDAYKSFLETREKNEIIFHTMICGFVHNSEEASARQLFCRMRQLGLSPDHSTLNCMLGAYTNIDMAGEGEAIHGLVVKTFGESGVFIGNNLIEMYSKSRGVDEAVKVFKAMAEHNEFSWTAMISGYIESERHELALELFHTMQASASAKPNQFTLVAVLQACSKLPALNQGKQTHGCIIKSGFNSHIFIESALIGLYAKCGQVDDALRLFSDMSEKDLVSWSAMISAFVKHGRGGEALKLLSAFQDSDVACDESILSSCLSACANMVELEMGKCLHCHIIKNGVESNLHVGCSIVDMYCKCGSLRDAHTFFDKMGESNVVSWTAIISGYAQHGRGRHALQLFDDMKEAGVRPDGVAFIGALSACSHGGLVSEGWYFFKSMREDYGLDATLNHYACMVDLLGRAGHLIEAEELIKVAPFPSKALLWRTLLGACSKHGNVKLGNRIAEILVKLEPDEPSTYVLLSNIFASGSMWDQSIQVLSKIQEGSMKKEPGCSWIEVAA